MTKKKIYGSETEWDIHDKNVAKSVADYKKIVKEKAKLMKTEGGLERPRIEGIRNVLYEEDWKKELKRDVQMGKKLSSAMNVKNPQTGTNVKDLVKLTSKQKEGRQKFKEWYGDYNKAAEQKISKETRKTKVNKNSRSYFNNTYEEGK